MMDPVAVFDNADAMRSWSAHVHRSGQLVALVPTMGALHSGHLALIAKARQHADLVVVSIFVNPLQFGEQNDFAHYPRPIDDDLEACAHAGVDAVYAPTAATMYPDGFETRVVAGALADLMEGASRPGHFDGVVTVVTKLFTAVRPDVAMFGEKDYQQLTIVRRLVADLDLGVAVIAAPTVREGDGLAMSSRNRRLDARQRCAARCVPAAIDAAVRHAAKSGATLNGVVDAAVDVIESESMAALDYVAIFDADTLQPVEALDDDRRRAGQVRIALAVRIGDVRLIDNRDLFAR